MNSRRALLFERLRCFGGADAFLSRRLERAMDRCRRDSAEQRRRR